MVVKQSGGRIFGATLTAKEQKALDMEIKRQLSDAMARHADKMDILILHTLHTRFGFGAKRLRRFYEAFIKNYREMLRAYQMDADVVWAADQDLKQIGVDVTAWNEEDDV